MREFKLRQLVTFEVWHEITVKAKTLREATTKACRRKVDNPVTGMLPGWEGDTPLASIVCGCGNRLYTSSDSKTTRCFGCRQEEKPSSLT